MPTQFLLTYQQALQQSIKQLKSNHITPTADLDARMLLSHACGKDITWLMCHDQEIMEINLYEKFQHYLKRRLNHEPVSKIIGQKEFFSLPFFVNHHTLDPRPDSEHLVQAVLDQYHNSPLKVLDMGTGSGCLILTLLHHRPSWQGVGLDICPKALKIAKKNAHHLNINTRCVFVQSDWEKQLNSKEKFHIIISNPPYIGKNEMMELSQDVRQFDPQISLTDHKDGYQAYEHFAKNCHEILLPQGLLFIEHGWKQQSKIVDIFENHQWKVNQYIYDFASRPRGLILKSKKTLKIISNYGYDK